MNGKRHMDYEKEVKGMLRSGEKAKAVASDSETGIRKLALEKH